MRDDTGLGFSDAAIRSSAGMTPLHAAANAGAKDAARKDWQDGLDAAVQAAVDQAARAGLNRRGRVRAADRAAAKYQRKHPRP